MRSFAYLTFLGFFVVFGQASLLDDILNALETVVDCAGCNDVLLPPLQTVAHLGNDAFVATLTSVCQLLGAADDDVCAGELERSGPLVAHALRALDAGGTTAMKFCEATFGLCQQPPITPFMVSIPKPAPENATRFLSRGRTPFQVVHFSDVHIDREYTVGADANCTKNICCRDFADHTGPITEPAGPFGNSQCDSPIDLAQSMLGAVGSLGKGAKFAIFTGDVVEGDTWLVNKSDATVDLMAWNDQMANSIGLTVYPSIGNHDSAPVNSFPRNTTVTTIDSQWVFDTQSSGWQQWIGNAAAEQVDHISGSYAINVPDTTLKIISLNTQYWYKQNFWLYDNNNQIADPNGLFAFVIEQLQSAEDESQRVWIIGHIPSGKADFAHDQSNYYDQIIQRYKNTIAAQFFGHSHMDQFEVAYSDWDNQTTETADSILFIAPALTPTSGNPAFKIYDVDPDTFEVIDAKVFSSTYLPVASPSRGYHIHRTLHTANISDPSFQTGPTWELYYSARDTWGPLVGNLGPSDPLNASFWHKLTEVFETNETAFQLYNTHLSRGGRVTACTDDCKTATICDLRAARSENNCVCLPTHGRGHGLDNHFRTWPLLD
ncbi:sphingomyelin phosphodiesterase [Amylostereum chailletii]|nr:sphingomyelin phosphodiesterase [Amylostereum chailletii]